MRTPLILIGCVLLIIEGCKKIDKLTQFNLKYDENVEIRSSTGINLPFNIFTPDINTNSESTFAVNNTRKDLIEEIKLTKLELSIKSPSIEDFSFLKSISVYISADGLEERKIALKDISQDKNTSVIYLDLMNVDLKDYIKKDKFVLNLNTVTDELLTSDYEIGVHSEFFVNAKILGQ